MHQFKIGDIVKLKYISGFHSYIIVEIRDDKYVIIQKDNTKYKTTINRIELVGAVPDVPVTFNQPINHNNIMKYFHTAVLVLIPSSTCQQEYMELVPYSVRNALNENDMRDTLVRELKKSVKTSDCKFLISQIF